MGKRRKLEWGKIFIWGLEPVLATWRPDSKASYLVNTFINTSAARKFPLLLSLLL